MSTPTPYSKEIARNICERIANGEALKHICEGEDYPNESTVHDWVNKKSEFAKLYAHARARQADHYAQEILEIADDSSKDFIDSEDGKKLDSEHVQRSKLRIDTRKWLAAKLAPKRYGDKTHVEHSGDAQKPLKINISIIGDD